MLTDVMIALNLASRVHSNQTRLYSKEPYLNHVVRVASNPRVVQRGSDAVCIALLHDCIEDSSVPEAIEKYIKDNFNNHIYESCKLLTHLEGSYDTYKSKILSSNNLDVLLIKASDSEDNSKVEEGMNQKHLKRCEVYKENVKLYLAKASVLQGN